MVFFVFNIQKNLSFILKLSSLLTILFLSYSFGGSKSAESPGLISDNTLENVDFKKYFQIQNVDNQLFSLIR